MPEIQPYIADVFPEIVGRSSFPVHTVSARRTFWEKALLLHEETFRPVGKPVKLRLAHHYYDLWCLITKGVADEAVEDQSLFERIAAHRAIFFRWSWMDYSSLRPGFSPPGAAAGPSRWSGERTMSPCAGKCFSARPRASMKS